MKTKDGRDLAPGSRPTLFYIDEDTNVQRLQALIGANGDTGYGPSGVPLAVHHCYASKYEALKHALWLLGNTIGALSHQAKEIENQIKVERTALEGSP